MQAYAGRTTLELNVRVGVLRRLGRSELETS